MSLLILPFDHRSSFSSKILGLKGKPNQEEIQKIKDLKKLIFEAFLEVRDRDDSPEELAILVDEQYGAEIINEANEKGITTAVGVEKSGQKVFTFEYGNDFGKHIEKLKPDYVKVLVRYNPENKRANKKQLKRLKKLSNYCVQNDKKLLFELLVPPTKRDKNSEKNFDTKIRPAKTKTALEEIQKQLEVSVWKLEGFDHKGWDLVLEAFPKKTRKNLEIVVLGRGEDEEKVKFWLNEAANFNETVGFAIGRTIFMKPLLKLLNKEINREEAKNEVAKNYRTFIDLWRSAKTNS
jgi:5-dehydro-2-deoxygluconokinase